MAENDDLYDVARKVTDEVLGDGTYAELNAGNPDPRVQAAIRRSTEETDMREHERTCAGCGKRIRTDHEGRWTESFLLSDPDGFVCDTPNSGAGLAHQPIEDP